MGCGLCLSSLARDFYNLGFNAPDISSLQTEVVPVYEHGAYEAQYGSVSQLLPGWQLAFDGVPVDKVYYTSAAYEGPQPSGITLSRPGTESPYSLTVFGGRVDFQTGQEVTFRISLSQRGVVPEDATELRFHSLFSDPQVRVTLDGNAVPVAYAGLPTDPYRYEADISMFSGKEVNLELSFPVWASANFDIYGFYPIPEPSTFALLGLAACRTWV